MLSHATARDWLIPYADGMLAADERKRIDGHLMGCAVCAAELREVRQLNLLLVSLPPAPPVAFAPFWLELQAVLPQRWALRIPGVFGTRRVALAFAMAALALVAAAGTALAAPAAMPDNPLYSVKQLEETVRLATAAAPGRLAVQLDIANERLREARVMAANHKPRLAAEALHSFQVTFNDASGALRQRADPTFAQNSLKRLRLGLDAVERENAARDDDDSAVHQLVLSSKEDLDRFEHPDAAIPTPPLVVGTQATPDPTPGVKPQPTPKPTPRPKPSDDDEDGHH